MFDRNKIVHWVIWPYGDAPRVELIDPDGQVVGSVSISGITLGSDLAKKVPNGFFVDFYDSAVFSMSGQVNVATKAPFDTAVHTERRVISIEERMAVLERRESRRERREERARRENERLRAMIEEREVLEETEVQDEGAAVEPQDQELEASGSQDQDRAPVTDNEERRAVLERRQERAHPENKGKADD